MEKEMATHSSILVWRIPWTEEPGGLQSIVLQRVGHDLTGLAFKVKKLGNFRPAHYSLHPPHSQEREREKLIPFFFFFSTTIFGNLSQLGNTKKEKKLTQGTQTRALSQPRGWKRVGGGREVQEGEDIYTPMADSCWCISETKPKL